jgi:hypothetical protein
MVMKMMLSPRESGKSRDISFLNYAFDLERNGNGSGSNSGMVVLFYSKGVPPHLWCFRNSNRSLILLIRSWDFTHRFINSLSGLIENCLYIGKCHIYIYRLKCI